MKQYSVIVESVEEFKIYLKSQNLITARCDAKSLLVSVYTAFADKKLLQNITSSILDIYSEAVVVGATTTGEINNGETVSEKTVVSFLFFDSTTLIPISLSCKSGQEYNTGQHLRQKIDEHKVSAVMLFVTPFTNDVNLLLRGFSSKPYSFEVFGGGAGNYSMDNSFVLHNFTILDSGVVAVGFLSDSLQIMKQTFLGWESMSQDMTITKTDGTQVVSINNEPALNVYQRYLGIKDNKNFFAEALGFPMLSKKKYGLQARVPISIKNRGALEFFTDFKEGETFRLGFVSPENIENSIHKTKKALQEFNPDTIFLFTCGCRRFALLDDVQKETTSLTSIAPISGFYTVGEIYNDNNELTLLNLSFVAIGMKETTNKKKSISIESTYSSDVSNKYKSSHTTVIKRLLYFIQEINKDIEEKNKQLEMLSVTDHLTKLYNRSKLDEVINNQLKYSRRYNTIFGVILLDIDFFKKINDEYGHLIGDLVLCEFSDILKHSLRETDILGRWGGEEFLILVQKTTKNEILNVAEKIRKNIESHNFKVTKCQTASSGIAIYKDSDTIDTIIKRADEALYKAKDDGRNCVKFIC